MALSDLNHRLEELARMDGLTGLTNRRAFDEALEREFGRSRRAAAPLSLLLVDVDHFKAFNDTYGHPAGDECLKTIATVLRDTLNRPADLIARYGGEEFAAILPDTDAGGAVAVAEAIRRGVRDLALPLASVDAGLVTASVGVSTWPGGDAPGSVDELVAEADEALYAAKAAGRDRVVASRSSQAQAATGGELT
jgi:diguanylate cyclase (GGDEF)-like protein